MTGWVTKKEKWSKKSKSDELIDYSQKQIHAQEESRWSASSRSPKYSVVLCGNNSQTSSALARAVGWYSAVTNGYRYFPLPVAPRVEEGRIYRIWIGERSKWVRVLRRKDIGRESWWISSSVAVQGSGGDGKSKELAFMVVSF